MLDLRGMSGGETKSQGNPCKPHSHSQLYISTIFLMIEVSTFPLPHLTLRKINIMLC